VPTPRRKGYPRYVMPNDEIIFVVEEAPEGGYTARALGESISTEADDAGDLHIRIRDAVQCHFDAGRVPRIIRLHVGSHR
jgi:hypothetical protein